ncbi:MAG TPA: sulfatase-like hydrolase/transferase [Thermoanaerobaculia bacterium]|nr:sulfatase-like hydrolase/transferase [Thermoanaerobaculia bacterium]
MNNRWRWTLLLFACALAAVTHAADRPNIVIFFMDDMGYSDLRIDGALDARTSHLDRLEREGVRLTDCYAAAPVCTPTRAAFMTGRYQHRAGIEGVLAHAIGNTDRGLPATDVADPGERKDLAAGRADVLRRLDGKHRAWERQVAPAKP